MNDEFEIWSVPWHAMQRRVANGFGAEAAARAATIPRGSGARGAAPAGSWLARALGIGPCTSPFQTQR